MENFKQLAIIGPTASGKTSLAIDIAKKQDAYILSLDSLSIYKEIDIVSAKPTAEERGEITHFGIDMMQPDMLFNVSTYIDLYNKVYKKCQEDKKNLVIVGGTSFYLKMLMEGISVTPNISLETKKKAEIHLQNVEEAHSFMNHIDSLYMSKIESADYYRIEKALHIYLESGIAPSIYFKNHPPKPIITSNLPIYQIETDKEVLRGNIVLRTKEMLNNGLINEITMLEKKYGRAPNCMKAIGIKETLMYLDGIYDRKTLEEKIITNTARLAKRQKTFNNSQFAHVTKESIEVLRKILLS